jgi:hypothetical protein
MPPGLSLKSEGVVSGTPLNAGISTIGLIVRDSVGVSTSKNLVLTINPAPLAITTSTLPSGQVGQSYSQTMSASGGKLPYTWSLMDPLVPGLTINPAGVLSGTPQTPGTYSIGFLVIDAASAAASKTLSLTINTAPLLITTTSLPPASVQRTYNFSLSATGGVSPYTWRFSGAALVGLPPGLSFSMSGTISGTPTSAGTYSVIIQLTDAKNNMAGTILSLVVTPPTALLAIDPLILSPGKVGVFYSFFATVTGGLPPYTWSTTSTLPPGLTMSGSKISGTPTQAGTYPVVMKVTDSVGNSASTTPKIVINP